LLQFIKLEVYNHNVIVQYPQFNPAIMNVHLKFSSDGKSVVSAFGEEITAYSKKEVFDALERMRQKNDILLPQLKEAMYEAIIAENLPWDLATCSHGGISEAVWVGKGSTHKEEIPCGEA